MIPLPLILDWPLFFVARNSKRDHYFINSLPTNSLYFNDSVVRFPLVALPSKAQGMLKLYSELKTSKIHKFAIVGICLRLSKTWYLKATMAKDGRMSDIQPYYGGRELQHGDDGLRFAYYLILHCSDGLEACPTYETEETLFSMKFMQICLGSRHRLLAASLVPAWAPCWEGLCATIFSHSGIKLFIL